MRLAAMPAAVIGHAAPGCWGFFWSGHFLNLKTAVLSVLLCLVPVFPSFSSVLCSVLLCLVLSQNGVLQDTRRNKTGKTELFKLTKFPLEPGNRGIS